MRKKLRAYIKRKPAVFGEGTPLAFYRGEVED